jgi:hypothetical protein
MATLPVPECLVCCIKYVSVAGVCFNLIQGSEVRYGNSNSHRSVGLKVAHYKAAFASSFQNSTGRGD